jgi:hypothetical protein
MSSKKILVFKPGTKAIVKETNQHHVFNLNQEISYVETIKNFDGTQDWHKFEVDGLIEYLVDGEYEIINDKKLRGVELEGCDATTPFNMEMTDEEFEFLKRVADLSKMYSRYGCMPTMNLSNEPIELYDEEDED